MAKNYFYLSATKNALGEKTKTFFVSELTNDNALERRVVLTLAKERSPKKFFFV